MTRPDLTTRTIVGIAIAIAAAAILISPTALAEHPSIQSSKSSALNGAVVDELTNSQSVTTTNESDEKFLKDFARINAARVRTGQFAQWKAEDARVKAYAKELIDSHSKTIAKIAAVSEQTHIDVKAKPSFAQKFKSTMLDMSVGHDFDRAYVTAMIEFAAKDIEMLQREIVEGQDPSIKQLALESLADVQNHLKVAQDLHADVSKVHYPRETEAPKAASAPAPSNSAQDSAQDSAQSSTKNSSGAKPMAASR